MSSNKTPTGTGKDIFDSGMESLCISSQDMFAYADYKKQCILNKQKAKRFTEWLKDHFDVAFEDKRFETTVDKALGK